MDHNKTDEIFLHASDAIDKMLERLTEVSVLYIARLRAVINYSKLIVFVEIAVSSCVFMLLPGKSLQVCDEAFCFSKGVARKKFEL